MQKLISGLIALSTRFSKYTVILGIIIALLSVLYAHVNLKLDTNQDSLISQEHDYFRDYQSFLKEFGDWEYTYVVIKGGTNSQQKEASKRIYKKLSTKPDLYDEVTNRIEWPHFLNHALLYLPQPELDNIKHFVTHYGNEFRNIKTLRDWYALNNKLLKEDSSENLSDIWPIYKSTLLAPYSKSALNYLSQNSINLFGSNRNAEGYLFSDSGKLLFIRILPRKDFSQMEIINEPLTFLKEVVDKAKIAYPELQIGITGRPVLQNDEATSTQSDSVYAGIISFLLIALLFFITLKNVRRPLFSLIALAVGIAWTAGFITFFIGRLNLISLVFAIILIGLGIDYGIHFLMRYLHEENKNRINKTTNHTGRAIIIGAITSAVAFATALFTDFLGLQELGIISAAGLLLCCLSQLTLFPALLHLFDNTKIKAKSVFSFNIPYSNKFLIIIVLLSIALIPLSLKSGFNHNLLDLQDPELESVKFEKIIQSESGFSTWFLAYRNKDLDKIRAVKYEIENLSSVKKTESILDLIPNNQRARLKEIKDIKYNSYQPSRNSLQQEIKAIQSKLNEYANKALSQGFSDEFEELSLLSSKLEKLPTNPKFEKEFLQKIAQWQNTLNETLDTQALSEDNLPHDAIKTFKSSQGTYSLIIYPHHNIWNPDKMAEFISEVQSIEPSVTGAPITTQESARMLVRGFQTVLILTSIIILIFLSFSLKSIRDTLIIFANLILTFTWLLAFMRVFHIDINLANFFALPVLMGSGIDHGVHIIHRFRETGNFESLKNTFPAILLSCLTTIIGFGSLAFVSHAGLASFGFVMAVGTLLILLGSLFVIPHILKYFSSSK